MVWIPARRLWPSDVRLERTGHVWRELVRAGRPGRVNGCLVRGADADVDAEACADIYRYFVENTTVSFEYEAPSAHEMTARMERSLASHEWLVAERDSELLGFAYASPWNPRPAYDWSCETTVYLRKGAEGGGVGTALYDELLGRLRSRGFQLAIGRIALPNPPSERLHESLGFQPVGVHHRLGFKLGRWVDVMHVELALQPGEPTPDPPAPPVR